MTNLNLRRLTCALALLLLTTGCESFNPNSDKDLANGDIEFNDQPTTTPSVATDEGGGSMSNEANISDLRYVSRKGGGTVVIESSSPLTFRTRENDKQNQYVVDIANARLPDRLKRPYITKDFNQAIASVNAYQEAGSSTAHVVVTFRAPTRATTTQTGNKLLVFATGPATNRVADDVAEIENLAKTASAEGSAGDTRILAGDSASNDGRYYGRPISIEVRDTNVRDVIQLISEQSGANIVLASGIDGNVTLKLKQIPWDQALMIVMKSQGLGYVRQGSVLRIATLDKIKAENEATKQIADAQLAAEPLKVKILPVSYATVADLVARVTPFLTKNRGAVVADARTSNLIVTDTPEIIERVSNLVKSLDTPPLQVQIEAKIVEAREEFSRNYGITWNLTGQPSSSSPGITQNNLGIAAQSASSVLSYNVKLGTFDILGDLDASLGLAEAQNAAKVLSSPRITTLNNEPAVVTQSTTINLKTQTLGSAGATASYTQTPVPLELKVTPQVSSGGDVLMKLDITRSFVGKIPTDPSEPPAIEKRQVTTNVMVRNGQTAVVGGVYQSDSSEAESGVPVLKNLPVVGWLFKNSAKSSSKNELLVFLTPRIINSDSSAQKEGAF